MGDYVCEGHRGVNGGCSGHFELEGSELGISASKSIRGGGPDSRGWDRCRQGRDEAGADWGDSQLNGTALQLL